LWEWWYCCGGWGVGFGELVMGWEVVRSVIYERARRCGVDICFKASRRHVSRGHSFDVHKSRGIMIISSLSIHNFLAKPREPVAYGQQEAVRLAQICVAHLSHCTSYPPLCLKSLPLPQQAKRSSIYSQTFPNKSSAFPPNPPCFGPFVVATGLA